VSEKPLIFAVLIVVGTLTIRCSSNNGSTTVVNGLDCQLIRDNLVGTWEVHLQPVNRLLQNCTGLAPGLNGTGVVTDDFPATYSPMDVFGSDGSTSFKLQADRNDLNNAPRDPELTGSVQADSCLAMVRVWDRTDALFYQCIGTFNIGNLTLSGACDSTEIDTDVDGQLDTSCSLSNTVLFDAGVH
jgi:hypothetical protein